MSDERRCPDCTEPVGPADRYCEGCGKDLLVHRTPVGGALGAPAGKCPACGGTEFAEGFCGQCGRAEPSGRDRMECDLGLLAGVGDRGRHRRRNEDSMAFAWFGDSVDTRTVVAVVCDGVASTERADQASQAAADAALDTLVTELLGGGDPAAATRKAVEAAMTEVTKLANRELPGTAPSCTFVSAVATSTGIAVGSVGDSRVYWLAKSGSRRLTLDDTVAAQLVAAGMDEAEASGVYNAHALSSWIGADAGEVAPRLTTLTPDEPGLLLLCSDGLWNYLPEPDQLTGRLPADRTPLVVAAELTAAANELGGHDNITVVVIPYPLRSP